MITENSAVRAIRIHESALYSQKLLAPKGASPLSALVASINSFQETGSIQEIVAQSFQKTSTIGTYAEIEEEIAKNSGKIISRIIHQARNVVNPKIKECIEEVEKWKAGTGSHGSYLPLIQQVELDPVFTDEMLSSLLKTYSNSNYTLNMGMLAEVMKVLDQALLDEDKVQLLSTGTGSLDSKITDYLNKQNVTVTQFLTYNYQYNPADMGISDLLISFIFLNGVCTGRNEKVLGVINNSMWLAELCNLQANIGNRLNMIVDRFTKAVAAGDVFIPVGIQPDWKYSSATITVIGENYRKWLSGKGTPEAMIGYCISKKDSPVSMNLSELAERPEFYAELYQQEMKQRAALKMNEELYRIPQLIGDNLTRIINKVEEDDQVKIALINKVKEAIKTPYYGNQDCVSYIRDVVCTVYTEGDDVKMVLSNIDSVLQETGKNDLDYAIYVSICRLVGRFIARQIDVIKQQ